MINDKLINNSEFLQSEYDKTLNLFNKGIAESGSIKSSDGIVSGSTSTKHSDYIEIKPSTTYTNNMVGGWGSSGGIAFYTSSKTFISGYNSYSNNYTQFTTPNNAKYVRISYYIDNSNPSLVTNESELMLVEGTTLPSVYQQYYGNITHQVNIEPVLLWENPSPNTEFNNTNEITLNANYNDKTYVVIGVKHETGDAIVYYKVKPTNSTYVGTMKGTNVVARKFDFHSNNKLTIGLSGNGNNWYCIPVVIYSTNIL